MFLCRIARIFLAVAGDCRLAATTDLCKGIVAAGNWTRLDSFSIRSRKSRFRARMSHARGHVSTNAVY